MPILGTSASGYVEQVYTLALTANNTQNWTVPAGVSKIGVFAAGGGGGGGVGGTVNNGGGGGGAAGAAAGFYDYSVTPGDVYLITVGSGGNGGTGDQNPSVTGNAGGSSSFSSLVTANGGGGGYGSAASFEGGNITNNSPNGGNASINATPVVGSVTQSGGVGRGVEAAGANAVGNNTALTLSALGGPFTLNFGGGGGSGQFYGTNTNTYRTGGTLHGGAGGLHGTNKNTSGNTGVNAGGAGSTGTGPGGGAGGGGQGGVNFANGFRAVPGNGGSGANGQVIIYTK